MPKNFLADRALATLSATPTAVPELQPPQREPLKVMLVGSPKAVTRTIHRLHRLGFAEVGEWSPLVPTQNPGEVLSILVRRLLM
ncbi:peptide ABC transporter substrate-binding protein [Oscillatoria sp. FACHB-1406]|uniref:peptide ABC transporter substrate-binding protein n=1 Tax=Oscillatoria sp. FACHB-1406 TaxID=2692846 RepID=UPI00168A3666|nr:peptide ABC transporter substrate-binding protein [Oscillatoria sp. FACHB-1406]MBD2578337.1 peptide ABC transporter substrate-binding protein [Oscillatoria sp. FACHB-1406]